MNNVPVNEIYKGISKFKYTPPKDNWSHLLYHSKSNYKEFANTIVTMEVVKNCSFGRFNQLETIRRANILKDIYGELFKGDIIKCNRLIADYLEGSNEEGKVVARTIGE